MRVVLSNRANTDLLRIYRYIAEHSPSAADAFAERVDSNFKNLARFPLSAGSDLALLLVFAV
jgi:plasmid stabilization system protein ParE